jgi:signal transduction histidine kinase
MAAHGYTADEWATLRVMQLPQEMLGGLMDMLARDGLVQVRTDRLPDSPITAMLRRYNVTLSMYLPLKRGDALAGILFAGFRGRVRPFSYVQQRIATGIAQLASIALENVRLVEELTRANQIKSEFVSTMSHELRTPLSVILGYTDILRDDLARSDQRETLGKIRRSGLELLEMIEATLDLNRLEAGKDPPVIERVQVGDLLDVLRTEYAAVGGRPETVLRWQPAPDLVLWTDRRKLKIILKNLVGNALKFTPRGEVVVGCDVSDDACTFRVRDTGIGIDAEQVPLIFEMFRQADGSDSRSHGGVGLGLYITHRLVTQLGGTVEVDSVKGRGTTFEVTLPLPVRAAAGASVSPVAAQAV